MAEPDAPTIKIVSNRRIHDLGSGTRRCSSACDTEELTESDRLLIGRCISERPEMYSPSINKAARKKLFIASCLCLTFMLAEIILGALVSILLLWVITGILVYLAVERVVSNDFEIKSEVMLITAGCGVAFNLILGCTLFNHGGHTHLGGGGHGHSHGSSHSSKGSKGYDHLNNAESGSTSHHSYGSIQENSTKKDDSNINVRAAFVHVIGDLIQSIGVLIAAFIIYFKNAKKNKNYTLFSILDKNTTHVFN
ncbi:LOW QUALITY PROTEIN: hypothetical protein KUTeg_000486 [Tegillarca granosa]|uniref:Cation efflux protein transmembrane domain-containing protein n=1 Tax=Tegillarca granosa TaxID=220873 RepID=A0ABQ9G0G4_TEGGR|nr:LOW QUALITY PROTEIN: hypothetical protein KUTeg_000486 [Tegillarca granosa]